MYTFQVLGVLLCQTKHQGAPFSADPKNSMDGTSAALESEGTAGAQ